MQDPDCKRQTCVQHVSNSIAVLRPASLSPALGPLTRLGSGSVGFDTALLLSFRGQDSVYRGLC